LSRLSANRIAMQLVSPGMGRLGEMAAAETRGMETCRLTPPLASAF